MKGHTGRIRLVGTADRPVDKARTEGRPTVGGTNQGGKPWPPRGGGCNIYVNIM